MRSAKPSSTRDPSPTTKLKGVLAWYFSKIYGRVEGPGTLPFYCDAKRVGPFAVNPSELAVGDASALFKLFVAMAMFQALRDVVIMRQQAAMLRSAAQSLLSTTVLGKLVCHSPCEQLASAATFDAGCSVQKSGGIVDCVHHPGAPCHVKEATRLLNRMGDMGKLPTSAWLHAWQDNRLAALLEEVQATESHPARRATLLVERFSRVYRVGEKLATMFTSALATPALAPGLTPWFPAVDGNTLVVVDTNVARAVNRLGGPVAARTYSARTKWIREQSQMIDLQEFRADVPAFSPRLVQQALYSFCSKSNRSAQTDDCRMRTTPCAACMPVLCPFVQPFNGD